MKFILALTIVVVLIHACVRDKQESKQVESRHVVSPYALRSAQDSAYRAGYNRGYSVGYSLGFSTGFASHVCIR